MAGERIAACACYFVALASPDHAAAVDRALGKPKPDIGPLLNRALENVLAKIRGEDVRAILGPIDDISGESIHAAARLSLDAIVAALSRKGVWDRRLTAPTRSQLITTYASSYISSWSRDRGMDLEEVQRLKAKGGVS